MLDNDLSEKQKEAYEKMIGQNEYNQKLIAFRIADYLDEYSVIPWKEIREYRGLKHEHEKLMDEIRPKMKGKIGLVGI